MQPGHCRHYDEQGVVLDPRLFSIQVRPKYRPPRHLHCQTMAYTRTRSLAVGETAVVKLNLRVDDLAFVDARTSQRMLPAGEYEVRVDLGPSATSAGEVVHSEHVASDVML